MIGWIKYYTPLSYIILFRFTYKMNLKLKIIRNKRNNQLLVALSRKKLMKQLGMKNKNPKFIDIEKASLEYE